MNVNLNHKKVVLIGATGSIGNGILRGLLQSGSTVYATYNTSAIPEDLTIYKKENKLYLQQVDILDKASIKTGLTELMEDCPKVDAFIYNPGICDDSLLPLMSDNQWESVIDINLNGAFYVSKLISKYLIRNKKGKMIFISSLKGVTGSYGQSNYAASKAALIGFSKSLAMEMGRFNITSNTICPGFIPSNLNANAPHKTERAINSSVLSKVGDLDELVHFIIFLLSDYVQSATGQVFHLDSRM